MFHPPPQTYYPYDFLDRTYAPDEARFWQPDRLATDNHGISPYIYCGGDPINYLDPTGMKRYYVNMVGELIDREQLNKNDLGDYADELEDYDQIVVIGQDGTVLSKSDLLPKNSLHVEVNYSSDKSAKITSIILNGNSIGSKLFEQLATDTKVEWSILQALSLKTLNQENYIGTSHMESKENALTFHWRYYIKRFTHLVGDVIHSHPSGSEGPSGIDNGHNDMAVAKQYGKLYPCARWGIFNPRNGNYIYYNANSNKYDFNFNEGTLPDCNVIGSRKK